MRSLLLLVALLGCRGAKTEDVPVITITAQYPGASGEAVEDTVVAPIEQAVNSIRGVRSLESRSQTDYGIVVLVLEPRTDVETALHDVRHALELAQPRLPQDVMPPTITRASRDDRPIVWLELRGSLPLTELSAFARETLVDELQRLPGVGGVELRGIAERRIIVHPDLDKLVALKLTLFEVLAVLQSTEVGSVEALGDVVIKQVDGAAVKLVDIARVEEGFEREPGDPALAIRAQSGAQKSKVLAAVRERLAKLERPAGVEVVEAPSPTPAPRAASLVVTISGPSLDELDKIADSYVAQLRGFEVVRDPPEGEWEQTVLPDRDRAATLGVPMTDIFATLRAVGTARVGRLGETDIVMKVMSPSLPLDKLFVRTRDGTLIPLAMVVSVKDGRSATILRINRERAIVLSIYGSADKARKVISEGALPPGYRIKLGP